MKDIALIIGNGLAIDYCKRYNLPFNTSQPLDWHFHPEQPIQVSPREAFPNLYAYADEWLPQLNNNHFELFRKIKQDKIFEVEVEARHFISMAFSHFSKDLFPSRAYPWTRFIRRLSPRISVAISFNYDLIAEKILANFGNKAVLNGFKEDAVSIFKPHGSCDMDSPPGTIRVQNGITYPLNVFVNGVDAEAFVVKRRDIMRPRTAPTCVLPHEENIYTAYQWHAPMIRWLPPKLREVKHCFVIGHSYGIADRPEIDSFLNMLPQNTVIHDCNPYPTGDFELAVKSGGMEYLNHPTTPLHVVHSI